MNLKRAKRIRRILKGKDSTWNEAVYVDSDKGKEKPHQKMYPLTLKEWSKKGMKTAVHYIPMKVGTIRLGMCGKKVYRRAKVIAQTF